jgi:PAS domain S-box-containing protein
MALLERRTLRLLQVNPMLCQMTGLTTDELLERNLLELFAHDKDRPSIKALRECARSKRAVAVRVAHTDGQVLRAELRFKMEKGGGGRQLFAVLRPLMATVQREDGSHELALPPTGDETLRHVTDVFGVAEDESAPAEGEEELRAKLAEKERLLQTLSRELRTPLASICSFAELLVDRKQADRETKEEFAQIILKESERMGRLLDDLLDLEQVEGRRVKLAPKEFDVRDAASDARDAARELAEERGIEIRGSFGSKPRWIYADRDKLSQVLMNLLGNAIKFSPEDSVVELRVRPGSKKERVEIAVTDMGEGISAEERERVFEPFHRPEQGEGGQAPGTGLGLTLCRELVRLHGGLIWVEAGHGGGSTFRVELPGLEEAREFMESERERREERERKREERRIAAEREKVRIAKEKAKGLRPASAASLPPLTGTGAVDIGSAQTGSATRDGLPSLKPAAQRGCAAPTACRPSARRRSTATREAGAAAAGRPTPTRSRPSATLSSVFR